MQPSCPTPPSFIHEHPVKLKLHEMSSWYSWSWRPRGTSLAVAILTWVFFLHVAGIYLFTRGFLLTRMALSDITSCPEGGCTLPPTHDRLVLLVIDALRFDFVSPDPPHPVSPFHHHVLTLPQELTRKDPSRSFLYNAYSDPPTTTMQRIKESRRARCRPLLT